MAESWTAGGTPSPPSFSQVFVLKVVKVLCFDTLLQVFILKVLALPYASPSKAAHGSGVRGQNEIGKMAADGEARSPRTPPATVDPE